MHFARAVGCEGIIVGVNLGGPEHVRIVFGALDGIEESARLLLCLFKQWRERSDALVGLTYLAVTRATMATCDTDPPRGWCALALATTAI